MTKDIFSAKRDWFWLGCCSFVLYALLLTQQYAGDGLRWVSAVTGPWPPSLGGTNHLLFPIVAWVWYHAIGIWLPVAQPLQSIQLLNAVAGALGVMFFAQIAMRLGIAKWAMWVATLCLIFAKAYWVNATDMVEVMPSVPLILLSIWLLLPRVNYDRSIRWQRCLLAGVALAAATAIYQASAFSLPALCAALWWQPSATVNQRLRGIALTLSSYIIVVGVLYIASFRFLETPALGRRLCGRLMTDRQRLLVVSTTASGSLFGWVWHGLGCLISRCQLFAACRPHHSRDCQLALSGTQYSLCMLVVWVIWRRTHSLAA